MPSFFLQGAPVLRSLLILAVIAGGLAVDQHYSQRLVDVSVWLLFLFFLWEARPRDRIALLACLGYAWLGELVLSPVLGLYEYREGSVPLFVPPGHVLLLMLGSSIAGAISLRLERIVPVVALPAVLLMGIVGMDTSALLLFAFFLACVAFGPQPRLYAVMFVLALAMEIYGVWLGNWRWADEALGFTFNNPPLAAGAFYCVLDWLVGLHSQAAPRTPLESPCTGGESRVSTRSENTNRPQSFGTFSYKRFTLDTPPPSTITSGSRMLITPASARASRSS